MEYTLQEYAEMLVDQYADMGEDLSIADALELAKFRELMGDVTLVS